MPRILLFFLVGMGFLVGGCGGQQAAVRTDTASVAEIEAYFMQEGFAFTSVVEGDETHRVGLSANGFIQMVLYGEQKPTYASITISGGPDSDELLEVLPYMNALAALVTPTWADAPMWIRTQVRTTPTHIMNVEETTHSGYRIVCGGSPEVVNLVFTTQ